MLSILIITKDAVQIEYCRKMVMFIVHLPDVADTGLAVLAVLGVFKAASIVPGCFDFCGYCFGITLLSRLFTTIVVFFKVILIIPGLPASLPGLLTCGFG